MTPSPTAIELVKYFEGSGPRDARGNFLPYLCPAGHVTIGYGHVVLDARGDALRGQAGLAAARKMYPEGMTEAEVEQLLRDDLEDFARQLRAMLPADTTQAQFDALLSFAYNIGPARMRGSTVYRFHCEGKRTSPYPPYDPELVKKGQTTMFRGANAPDAFLMWNKANDASGKYRFLRGLYVRRHAERAVYLGAPWRKSL